MEAKGSDSATSNWVQSERLLNYDGGNGDELHGAEGQVNGETIGGYNSKDLIADSNWDVRGEGSEEQGSSDVDPLVQSICTLQSAQEALEKELLKFKEVGTSNVSSDVGVCDVHSEVTSLNLQAQATKRKYTEAELEDLFMLEIEAGVEHLVISRTIQKLRMAAVDQLALLAEEASLADQIALLEEKSSIASKQAQMQQILENTRNEAAILKKEAEKLVILENTRNEAAILKKEAEKLMNSCDYMASADEALMMESRICKYTSCFFIQLVMLVSILGLFIVHISSNYAGVVPT